MSRNQGTAKFWIGQSLPRNPERRDAAGGTQFYYSHKPGWRGGITREFLLHGAVSLHARWLISWEKKMYAYAQEQGLPFTRYVDSTETSITTELAGLSVKHMLEDGDLPIVPCEAEVAAIVIGVFRTNAVIADAGVMPLDGHLNNHLVWLENGLEGGYLDFGLIKQPDHTYTIRKGGRLRKPPWCSSLMPHFAPEAKYYKQVDEEAFASVLVEQGFSGDSLGDMVRSLAGIEDGHQQRAQRWRLERAYETYGADQQLQTALDTGSIEPHRMIQFALATCFLAMLDNPRLPVATRKVITRVRSVLEPMRDPRPEKRHATLHSAADALQAVLGEPLSRSMHPWPQISPELLIWNIRGTTDPDPAPSPTWNTEVPNSTFSLDDIPETPSPSVAPPVRSKGIQNFLGKVCDFLGPSNPRFRHRVRLGGIVTGFLLITIVASIRLPQTPEEAVQAARKAYVRQIATQVESRDPKKAAAGLEDLKALLRQGDPLARQEIDRITTSRFSALERKYLRRGLISPVSPIMLSGNLANQHKRREVVVQLQSLAELGSDPARQWAEAILKANPRGTDAVGSLAVR